MPRKTARRREPTPKQEGEQIVEAAAKAGADYAHEQVGSPHFSDWVSDQITEGEEMRRADPDSVIPLETPADARKVARNMLQQLEWDTERQMDTREILEMAGATGVFGAGSRDWVKDTYGITAKDVTDSFFGAFRDVLESASTRDWLTDEVLVRIEEVRGVPTSGAAREPVGRESTSQDLVQSIIDSGGSANYERLKSMGWTDRQMSAAVNSGALRWSRDGSRLEVASQRQPAREARPQAGMTPEQRSAVVAALRHYGADLTDDDFIRKGEKVLGVRVEVRKGRLRMVQVTSGSALASYPIANVGTGVADFVEKFWYWKPIDGGVAESTAASVTKVNLSRRGIGTRVVLPDGWTMTFVGPMPKGEAIRQAEWHRSRGEKSETLSHVRESGAPVVAESKALTAARTKLAAHGMSIQKTGAGDYRVYPKGSRNPDDGYFTDDLDDAVATGVDMARRAR